MGVISSVEDAILGVVNTTLPGVLRDTGSLPGAWSVELLKLLLQKAPGVFVAFNGGDMENSASAFLVNARFDVYVVTKEPTELTRRRGSGGVIGAYDIIEALMPALNGYLIPGTGSLRAKSITNLFANILIELGGTVYAMQFTLPRLPLVTGADLTTLLAGLAKFEILNIDSSLTAPGADDFTTTINLPQGG